MKDPMVELNGLIAEFDENHREYLKVNEALVKNSTAIGKLIISNPSLEEVRQHIEESDRLLDEMKRLGDRRREIQRRVLGITRQ